MQGTAGLLAGPGQLLERELPRPAALWREGHEFASQTEAATLAEASAAVAARVPGWACLVMATLRELRLQEAGHGTDWTDQPAWKVELWEAFWRGRLQARAAQECERW